MRIFSASALMVFFAVVPVAHTRADDQVAPMRCDIGPLPRTYGGTDWVVYSCSDRKTVVIHTAASNPGKEFYFLFTSKEGELRLHGEGNGDRKYTSAAFEELKPMTQQDLDALIKETETVMTKPATGG